VSLPQYIASPFPVSPLITPLSLLPFGDFEAGILFGNYFGLFLIIAAEVSIGCFISSMTSLPVRLQKSFEIQTTTMP
jgi:hypothetical protein